MAQTRTARSSSGQEQSGGGELATTAREAAEIAREEMGNLRERAGQRARETFDQRSNELAAQMGSAAGAIRQASGQLREQGSGGAASVVQAVADRTDRLGSYLQQTDAVRLLGDVESFARKRPWLVAGAAAAVGFLASRLLKASSSRRYADGNGGWQPAPGRGASYAAGATQGGGGGSGGGAR